MSSIRETILEAVVSAINGTTPIAGVTGVYRSRVEAIQRAEAPAIVVEPLKDFPQRANIGRTGWTLTAQVMIIVRDGAPDQAIDPIASAVHNRIMSDTTLDAFPNIFPGETAWTFLEADVTLGICTMQFIIEYQTSNIDIGS